MEEEINAQMKYKKLLIEVSLKFDNTKQRKNRYFLSYIWDNKKPALGVIMFNPSYANEIKPDRTHARLINKFQDKYGGLKVLNLISTFLSMFFLKVFHRLSKSFPLYFLLM